MTPIRLPAVTAETRRRLQSALQQATTKRIADTLGQIYAPVEGPLPPAMADALARIANATPL